MALRCRPLYEDQDARISILANGIMPKGRIRFRRLLRSSETNRLPTGRAIRFCARGVQGREVAGAPLRGKRLEAPVANQGHRAPDSQSLFSLSRIPIVARDRVGLKDDGAPPIFRAGRASCFHSGILAARKNRDPHRRLRRSRSAILDPAARSPCPGGNLFRFYRRFP